MLQENGNKFSSYEPRFVLYVATAMFERLGVFVATTIQMLVLCAVFVCVSFHYSFFPSLAQLCCSFVLLLLNNVWLRAKGTFSLSLSLFRCSFYCLCAFSFRSGCWSVCPLSNLLAVFFFPCCYTELLGDLGTYTHLKSKKQRMNKRKLTFHKIGAFKWSLTCALTRRKKSTVLSSFYVSSRLLLVWRMPLSHIHIKWNNIIKCVVTSVIRYFMSLLFNIIFT